MTREEMERRQGNQALAEIGQALLCLGNAFNTNDPQSKRQQAGRAISLLDIATYRIARIGTDKSFANAGKSAVEEATKIFQQSQGQMTTEEWLAAFGVNIHQGKASTKE